MEYADEQLDTLAVFMTAVKVLFLGGGLMCAARTIMLLEPAIKASKKPLHTTLIRNEVISTIGFQPVIHVAGSGATPLAVQVASSSMHKIMVAHILTLGASGSFTGAPRVLSLKDGPVATSHPLR